MCVSPLYQKCIYYRPARVYRGGVKLTEIAVFGVQLIREVSFALAYNAI